MDLEDLKVKASVETSGADEGLDKLIQSFKQLQTYLKDISSNVEKTVNGMSNSINNSAIKMNKIKISPKLGIEDLKTQKSQIQSSLEGTKNLIENYSKQIANIKSQISSDNSEDKNLKLEAQAIKLQNSINKLKGDISNYDLSIKAIDNSIEQYIKEEEELVQKQRQEEEEIRRQSESMYNLNRSIQSAIRNIQQFKNSISSAITSSNAFNKAINSNAFNNFKNVINGINQKLRVLRDSLNKTAVSMKQTFNNSTIGGKINSKLQQLNPIIQSVKDKFVKLGNTNFSQNIKNQLKQISEQAKNTSSSISNTTNGIKNKLGGFNSVIKGLAFGYLANMVYRFGKSCVDLGSQLTEVQNVVDVTFGNMSNQINDFAKNAMSGFGLSEYQAKQFTGTMGAMLKSMGLSGNEMANMSMNLTQLAGDMASFYNISGDQAFEKIRAGISGETEPLKQLGINLSVANLEAYAMSQGIQTAYNKMSQSQQAILRYNYLLSVTKDAQGDFARTSNSWANQTRILSLQFQSLKGALGRGLISALTPVIRVINILMGKLVALAETFANVMGTLFGFQSTGGGSGLANAFGDTSGISDGLGDISSGADDVGGSLDKMGNQAKKAKKELDQLASFDELHVLQDTEDDGEDGGTGGIGGMSGMGGLQTPTINTTPMESSINNAIEGLKEKLSTLLEPITNAWNNEGANLIESIKFALDSVWQLIKDIGTSFAEVWTNGTGQKTIELLLQLLQKVFGAIGEIGTAIDEVWTDNDFGKSIVQHTWDAINSILELLNHLSDKLKEVWDNGGKYCFEQFVQVLGNLWNILMQVIEECIVPMAKALSDLLAPVMGKILEFLGWLLEKLNDFLTWCTGDGAEIFNFITTFVLSCLGVWEVIKTGIKIFETLKEVWVILQGAGTILGGVIAFLTSPIGIVVIAIGGLIAIGVSLYKNWDTIKEKCGQVWDWIKNKFEWFKNWLGGVFATDWSQKFGSFGDIMNSFLQNVKNIWEAVKRVFGGIIDFVKGVFTGNWKQAWQGVKNIFGGIFDGLKAVAKAPLNAVIGLVNGCISGINTAIKGINHMPGVNISTVSKIPYLAKGGVVDSATLAMIGEAGKEAVVPLKNNTQWTGEVAGLLSKQFENMPNSNNNNNQSKQPLIIQLYNSNKELTLEQVIDDINSITDANGGICPLHV